MKSIHKYYKKFDIFGQEAQLLVKGEQTLRTSGGATLTIIMFSILIFAMTSFIIEMNQGKNANLNTKSEILDDYEGFSFNASDFVFAVGMLDAYGQIIRNDNNRVFNVQFYACTKTLNQTTCEIISSSICGDKYKQITKINNVPEQYTTFTYCMDDQMIKQNGTARIQGSLRSTEVKLISAWVLKCVNSTEFQDCAPQEEIDSYFKRNSNIYYAYTSHQFNKELSGNPYKLIQGIDITPHYSKIRKYIKIYYKYSQSILEYNPFYFFQSTISYDGVEYEKIVVDTAIDYDDQNSVAQIEIYLDSNKILRFVNYQTLMDVAAKVGGFFSLLRMVFTLIFKPFSQIIYNIYLINSYQKAKSNFRGTQREIKFQQLVQSRQIRIFYSEQLQQVKQLLDISENLVNPVKLTSRFEHLYISIQRSRDKGRFCSGSEGNDQQFFNIEELKSPSLSSINQECPSEKQIVKT